MKIKQFAVSCAVAAFALVIMLDKVSVARAQSTRAFTPAGAPPFVPVPTGAAAPGTIASTGRGVVRVIPDRARFTVHLYPKQGSVGFDDAGKSVTAALVANGIADAKWNIPLTGVAGPATQPVIVGSIEHPTRADLESRIRAVFKSIPDSAVAAIQNYDVNFTFEASDCSAAEKRAIAAAFGDARERAKEAAEAGGVKIGNVIGLNVLQNFTNGCPTRPDTQPPQVFIGMPNDPYGEPSIFVNATINVTFALR